MNPLNEKLPPDVAEIVQAEFNYWKEVNGALGIGAVAASSNIFAALQGHRAP